MKKVFRKSMFVLSFMGLFTFAAPKEVRAESNPCYTIRICCDENNKDCHNVEVCNGDDILSALKKYCGVTISVVVDS